MSAEHAGGLIGGAVAVLTMLGGAIKWAFRRADESRLSREQKMQTWHLELKEKEAKLDQGRTAYIERLEARLELLESNERARDTQLSALRVAFELVSKALRHIDPANTALHLAEDILRNAFPVPAETPRDMVDQLVAIETLTTPSK
ncbi:hypothetical protein [Rhizorhabdus sp.]|uniref:hypothetical protein n=1 Tax=Rhizorhabdus sp. TaxID=1968843 RepID=UPI0035B1C506